LRAGHFCIVKLHRQHADEAAHILPVKLPLDNYDLAGFVPRVTGFGADRFGFVVTPNVDHVIRYHDDAGFRALYAAADYILLDSRVLALMLRLSRGLRVRVCPGSDLTATLFRELVSPADRVVLIGASAQQAQRLAAEHGLRDLRHHCPPMGFIRDPAEVEACLQFIENASPFRYCLIAVGSPQQETVAAMLKGRARARGLALCIGASINFLTGVERRAPRWMQHAHLEWLFRLASEPGRMAKRYLLRGPRVFWLLRSIDVQLRDPQP
jgi:exopolysaccharide biosynthesis WecB/TagA/CpsF family protein